MRLNTAEAFGFNISSTDDSTAYYLQTGQYVCAPKGERKLEFGLANASSHEFNDHDAFFDILNRAIDLGMQPKIALVTNFEEYPTPASVSLEERLQPFSQYLAPGCKTLALGKFEEPEYIQLLAQVDEAGLDTQLKNFFTLVEHLAAKSKQGNSSNYVMNTSYLLRQLSKITSYSFLQEGIPAKISGFKEGNTTLDQSLGGTDYERAIVQPNGSSFTYTPQMEKLVALLITDETDGLEKSKIIHEWITSNIEYDHSKAEDVAAYKMHPYRSASQTFRDRTGICGESAALQVTLERLAGNTAFLAEVKCQSEEFNHAVGVHLRSPNEFILVDTTSPKGFNAKYDEFRILSDEHSMARQAY